jgi:ATP-dependent Lon protease
LKPSHIELPDETLESIAIHYTAESGVRQLERKIGAVCRSVSIKLSNHTTETKSAENFETVRVAPDDLIDILGVHRFENDIAEQIVMPGVAIGLAWT